MNTAEAYDRCLALTRDHYENFPVARMVPAKLRPSVAAVYSFARVADDIADEGHDSPSGPTPEQRLARLRAFDAALLASSRGEPTPAEWEWIFTALADTRQRHNLPLQLFQDLLSAFSQDVTVSRYATFTDVLDYCRRSANPIGRLVLLLHGFDDKKRFGQSDAICTALQLANFWQDMAVDWKKDRVYVPQEDWQRHGVTESDFAAKTASPGLRACMNFQVERTRNLFQQGRPLPESLPFPLSLEIRITWLGGNAILDKILSQDCDTLRSRPALNTFDKIRLLFRGFFSI